MCTCLHLVAMLLSTAASHAGLHGLYTNLLPRGLHPPYLHCLNNMNGWGGGPSLERGDAVRPLGWGRRQQPPPHLAYLFRSEIINGCFILLQRSFFFPGRGSIIKKKKMSCTFHFCFIFGDEDIPVSLTAHLMPDIYLSSKYSSFTDLLIYNYLFYLKITPAMHVYLDPSC